MWFGLLDDQTFRWAPDRALAWSQAKAAHASVIRTVVRWDQIAKTRPAHRLNPFDPAYNFRDLDDFVISAQQRGIEVLLTLWGTPAWANGGAGPAVPPTDTADFAALAHVVAERYSGTYPGLPFARFFSIWNEPNSPTFLQAPDPAVAYAALAEAGYSAVKSASPAALVAVGGYGWCAQASNRKVGSAAASCWTNVPGACAPAVSPTATRAAGLADLTAL